MIEWGIIVVVLIIGILAWAALEDRLRSAICLRRLKKENRCISATQAIDEYERGLGQLVKNESLLPGSWWFLRNDQNRDDCDLLTAMRQFGHVVLCEDIQERRAIEAYTGKVEVMLEPFDK